MTKLSAELDIFTFRFSKESKERKFKTYERVNEFSQKNEAHRNVLIDTDDHANSSTSELSLSLSRNSSVTDTDVALLNVRIKGVKADVTIDHNRSAGKLDKRRQMFMKREFLSDY